MLNRIEVLISARTNKIYVCQNVPFFLPGHHFHAFDFATSLKGKFLRFFPFPRFWTSLKWKKNRIQLKEENFKYILESDRLNAGVDRIILCGVILCERAQNKWCVCVHVTFKIKKTKILSFSKIFIPFLEHFI